MPIVWSKSNSLRRCSLLCLICNRRVDQLRLTLSGAEQSQRQIADSRTEFGQNMHHDTNDPGPPGQAVARSQARHLWSARRKRDLHEQAQAQAQAPLPVILSHAMHTSLRPPLHGRLSSLTIRNLHVDVSDALSFSSQVSNPPHWPIPRTLHIAKSGVTKQYPR